MKFVLHTLKFFYFLFSNFPRFLKSKFTNITKEISKDIEYELILSNCIGGGTETYLQNYLKSSNNCLILRVHSYLFDYYYEIEDKKFNKTIFISFKDIKKLLSEFKFYKITVNTLVNYFSYKKIISLLVNYECNKKYMLHDFYCLCPVPCLFTNGNYCKIENCKTNKCFNYNFYALPKIKSVYEWRKTWKILLESMDEIRCFSEDSYNLFTKVYSDENIKRKLTIIPHDMSYCRFKPIIRDNIGNLHIGIIGTINTDPKGIGIVRSLLKYVSDKNNIEITIIGTLPFTKRIKNKKIHYTGKYAISELQEIVEKSGVNCFLFPSLWPETFSYCVSEFMQFNLPLACFDIGAQRDKVKKYAYGIILKETTPESIIDSLVEK